MKINPENYSVSPGRAEDLALVEVKDSILDPLEHKDGTVLPRYAKIVYNINQADGNLPINPENYKVSPGRAEDLALVEVKDSVLPRLSHKDGTTLPRYAKIVYLLNPPDLTSIENNVSSLSGQLDSMVGCEGEIETNILNVCSCSGENKECLSITSEGFTSNDETFTLPSSGGPLITSNGYFESIQIVSSEEDAETIGGAGTNIIAFYPEED